MEDCEKSLLDAFTEMSACLKPQDARWATMWQETAEKTQQLFAADVSVRERYDFVTDLQGYYRGMGSFNDTWIPPECEQSKSALYKCIRDARRYYWKQLGNEWHDYSRFKLLPIGTKVKLVPGKVASMDGETGQFIVPEKAALSEEIWTVVNLMGPDVSNMPTYTICSGTNFRLARHEALEVVSEE